MADQVTIEFGAKVDQLINGVNQVKESVASIQESVGAAGEVFGKLGEIIGLTFSVEAIKQFIESMAELGLQTERTMATLGLSSEQVGELTGVAKLTGTSIEGMSLGIERMSLNIQRSTRDATNPAAQALKVLGLNAKDLIGIPTDQYFLKLADAVSKFEPSLNRTNAIMAIGGRGVQQLIPLLDQGSAGFTHFEQAVKATGSALTEAQTRAFAESHVQMTLLGLSAQGLGVELYSHLVPAVTAVAEAGSKMLQWMRDSIKEGGAFEGLGNAMASVIRGISAAVAGLIGLVEALAKAMQTLFLAATFQLTKEAADKMVSDFESIGSSVRDTISAVYAPHITVGPSGGGRRPAGAIDESGKGASEAAKTKYQGEIAAADDYYKQVEEKLKSQLSEHLISQTQETAQLLAALKTRLAAELAATDGEIALYARGSKEYEAAINEREKILRKFAIDQQKIEDDAMKETIKTWDSAAKSLQGAWDSQLKGLLAGTTSWSTAMQTIIGDMVLAIIKKLETIAIEAFIAKVATAGILPGIPIPGFQSGTPYVPSTGLAILHQGEAVIPASQNVAGSGAGLGATINVSAIDAAGTLAFFQSNRDMISRLIFGYANQNPSVAGG